MNTVTPGPIDPDDIRVGDKIRRIRTDTWTSLATGGLGRILREHRPSDSYVLLDRPAPKPEVGQHWLDEQQCEWVVVEGTDNDWFYPLRTSTRWASRSANAAPAGWTQVKS